MPMGKNGIVDLDRLLFLLFFLLCGHRGPPNGENAGDRIEIEELQDGT